VISADERTQIPIRTPCHEILPPAPGRAMRIKHEYRLHGVCAYVAAWDVHQARLFGKVVDKISIEGFDGLVAEVMAQDPYRSARRVFWIVDGGTIHRGERAVCRLQGRFPSLVLVHLPTHASWLNQIEIHFSILQRKALTPAISRATTTWQLAFSASRTIIKQSPAPSSGSSRGVICAVSWSAQPCRMIGHARRPPDDTSPNF